MVRWLVGECVVVCGLVLFLVVRGRVVVVIGTCDSDGCDVTLVAADVTSNAGWVNELDARREVGSEPDVSIIAYT